MSNGILIDPTEVGKRIHTLPDKALIDVAKVALNHMTGIEGNSFAVDRPEQEDEEHPDQSVQAHGIELLRVYPHATPENGNARTWGFGRLLLRTFVYTCM